MNFASDNWAGATPEVMSALTRHSTGFEPAYGNDPLTEKVTRQFSEIFEREVAVFFVATGSAANSLALAAFARPGAVIFCHEDAHIRVDECGCPEFMTGGGKLVGIAGEGGKLKPDALEQAMAAYPEGVVHHGQATAVSITQATECGTVYTPNEILALKEVAAARRLPLHMDGARFANALVSGGVSAADMTWRSGVDVLSFGATKNGCWCAEAVVFFDPDLARGFEYFRKRAGHLFSKSRFVSAQLDGYFQDDTWLRTAGHANAMAARLAKGVETCGGRLAWPTEANEVFPIIKRSVFRTLEAKGARLYEWPSKPSGENGLAEDEVCLRLVTSFATQEVEVDTFLTVLSEAAS